MSNPFKAAEQECDTRPADASCIRKLLQPRERDLGGFMVRRLLPTARQRMVGPWIFFDHIGPAEFPAGEGLNVLPHPHIGLATVTYLFEGEILHRDSLGNVQAIRPGDINLMMAGRGIVHSERERPEVTAREHHLHGLQLWLALPENQEENEPGFGHYPATSLPTLEINGVTVRVMMGSAYGQQSPVDSPLEALCVEADLQAGQTLVLPDAVERALYVASGAVEIQNTKLSAHGMAVLDETTEITVEAREISRIALVGGQSPGKRFIDWNFVSSDKERIKAARADWKAGRFPTVPGDEDEFVPLP